MKAENKTGRIKKTRWFTSLFIWWVVAVFFYLFIAANENHQMGQVRDKGLKTILDSAQQAGLPLLERDVQALTRLTQEVHRLKGVVNVSIIDHKNKIIAYSNPGQLLRMPSNVLPLRDGVSYWPHTLDDGTQAVCFSTDIAYAGTKIGELFLAMDASGSAGLHVAFFLTAVISFLLVVFVLLVVDFHGVGPLKAAVQARIRAWVGGNDELQMQTDREVICPVCGSHKVLDRSFLLQANLNRYPVVRTARKENETAPLLFARGVNLRDISRREDLGWLRQQMIHRCADIIKKLAGD